MFIIGQMHKFNQQLMSVPNVINQINPDILCLQQATVGISIYYKKPIDIREYLKGSYELISSCTVIPSWYDTTCDNNILIKKDLVECIKSIGLKIFQNQCDVNRCRFNQYAKTYNNPEQNILYQEDQIIKLFKNKETRYFIKISFADFDIFCTHLDAYDSHIRKRQLDELHAQITRKSIIVGDFNIIDVREYENLPKSKSIGNKVQNGFKVLQEKIEIFVMKNQKQITR